MKQLLALLAVVALLAAPVAAGQSQADYQALRKEMDLMRARLAALQKEIDLLKTQRAAAPAPVSRSGVPPGAVPENNVVMSLARAPMRGAETARVTLVEVSDFECPFCARYSNQTSGQIVREFVDTGKIRYAFVQLPIASHRNAFKAAEASLCAGDQGKFWQMHDRLFQNQAALARPLLPASASAIGLRVDTFNSCLDSARHAPAIQADIKMVQQFGVRATPTFFIGTMDPRTKSFKASHRIVGAKVFGVFQQTLNNVIAGGTAPAP